MDHSKTNNDAIIIMTGGELRHQYFINRLNAKFPIAAVFIDSISFPNPPAKSAEEKEAWDWFFERRKNFENRIITPKLNSKSQNKPDIYYLKKNELNSPHTQSLLKKYSPGFIAIFGTGIMDDNFLSFFPDCIFNLHTGIPEFYRGSSCNFWPIYNEDLKMLGATIHRVEKGIDTGNIAVKKHIHLETNDDEQSLIWKTLKTGTQLMEETIEKWKSGTLVLKKQKQTGTLYKMKDFKPAAILKVKKMVESEELKTQIKSALG